MITCIRDCINRWMGPPTRGAEWDAADIDQRPNNLKPYLEGRADQRIADLVVGIVCLISVAIFVVFGK